MYMKYINGVSLFEFIDLTTYGCTKEGKLNATKTKRSGLTENMLKNIFYQIAVAVNAMHNISDSTDSSVKGEPIIYRDLNPNNVMITLENGKLKVYLIDFGISCQSTKSSTQLGTPVYRAPETEAKACTKELYYGKEVDIFSFGATLYTCLTGLLPNENTLIIPSGVSVDLVYLLESCLQEFPKNRMESMAEILRHSFFANTEKEYTNCDVQISKKSVRFVECTKVLSVLKECNLVPKYNA